MVTHIGLIGGGNITDTHARAALAIPDVAIAAIYGVHREKVDALCRAHSGIPFTDFKAFLACRPMDMVAIGSPSGWHATHGIAAARQGLHVLTEKPIDISTERADTLIAEADKAGVKLGVFFQDRLKPDVRRLRQWLDAGALGTPILADARVKWYRPAEYYSQSRWRGTLALDGGGALINQGVHTVDLLLWLFGDVARVQARMATALHEIEVEDTLVALLEFSSGALGSLVATTAAFPGYPRRLELTGSEGTVILEQDRLVRADLRTPPGDLVVGGPGDENSSATSPTISDARGHQAIFENFLHAIRENTRPVCDGREGRRSLAFVEAIYKACRTQKPVQIG